MTRSRIAPPALALVIALSGCGDARRPLGDGGGAGDGGTAAEPVAPPPPVLRASGSLHNIHLSWTPSPDATGYHVYRSTDGATFDRRTAEPVTATSYDDAIESPAGDGVMYRYRVTAIGDLESAPSTVAEAMHGTRLAAMYSFGLDTRLEDSPYVAEGTSTFVAGGLLVNFGTKLYALPGAVLDFECHFLPAPVFRVNGLLRATGTAAAPVRFTAHRAGGAQLASGEGFNFALVSSVPYQPADGSGTLLDHVEISNLRDISARGTERGGMVIVQTGVKLTNLKIAATNRDGVSRIAVQSLGWILLENSYLHRIGLSIATDVRTTPFHVANNAFRLAANTLIFDLVEIPALAPGQIEHNDFGGLGHVTDNQATGAGDIPLGDNYWGPGEPPGPPSGNNPIRFDFHTPQPPLVEPPAAGPDW